MAALEYEKIPETGCCPKFDPQTWEEKELTWTNKLFMKDHAMAFFHIPLNLGKVIPRMWEAVQDAGAEDDFILLSNDPTPWRTDQFMPVSKEVLGFDHVRMSGDFMTKVFEGPYREAKHWVQDMEKFVEGKNRKMADLYFYYTTCPKCAEVYGKNYVVAFARVE